MSNMEFNCVFPGKEWKKWRPVEGGKGKLRICGKLSRWHFHNNFLFIRRHFFSLFTLFFLLPATFCDFIWHFFIFYLLFLRIFCAFFLGGFFSWFLFFCWPQKVCIAFDARLSERKSWGRKCLNPTDPFYTHTHTGTHTYRHTHIQAHSVTPILAERKKESLALGCCLFAYWWVVVRSRNRLDLFGENGKSGKIWKNLKSEI